MSRKKYLKYVLITFLCMFISIYLILLIIEYNVHRERLQTLHKNEERVMQTEHDFLAREFTSLIFDVRYLKSGFMEQLLANHSCTDVAGNWLEFSNEQKIYDQIRFLAADGEELIRINYTNQGSYIVDASDLQNKGNRYYFQEATKLQEGQIYVSILDLNVENNEIEIPYKPMIRFSTPIYDENHELYGVIVVNYLAKNTLDAFRELAKYSNGEIILVNEDGYRLSSNNALDDWHFMFAEEKDDSFALNYPNVWQNILLNKSYVENQNGVFFIDQLDYASDSTDAQQEALINSNNWYIISHIPYANSANYTMNLWQIIINVFLENSFIFIFTFIISLIIASLVSMSRSSYAKMRYYADYDGLTKMYNRRAGLNKIYDLIYGNELKYEASLCFIDINGLKQVNDNLGHKAGDELIVTVSKVLLATVRDTDICIRLGGDEFLIVFAGVNAEKAEKIYQRIVAKFTEINDQEQRAYIISISHGIETYNSYNKSELDTVINQADAKMYQEKQVIKKDLNVIR